MEDETELQSSASRLMQGEQAGSAKAIFGLIELKNANLR